MNQNLFVMKRIPFILIMLIMVFGAYGQGEHQSTINKTNWLLRNKEVKMNHENPSMERNVEGSPYLSDDFLPGRVFYKGNKKPVKADLRYNAYSGEFEFTQGGRDFVISNKSEIDSIQYKGYNFIFGSYKNEAGITRKNFMASLVDGKCSIYKVYSREFHQAEPPATGYDEAEPARFEEESPVYCIQFGDDEMPHVIDSFRRGKFLNHFGSLEKELKRYIKDQNLRLRREDDLVAFIRYYNRHY
jgi:hypothetical protein